MVNNGLSFLVSVCFTDAHGVWLYADEAPFTVWTKTVDLKKKKSFSVVLTNAGQQLLDPLKKNYNYAP